jgi:hypothetical protein
MLAAAKPKKWVAFGLSIKVMIVAIIPVMVIAPDFLTHHMTKIIKMMPVMSQKNGK